MKTDFKIYFQFLNARFGPTINGWAKNLSWPQSLILVGSEGAGRMEALHFFSQALVCTHDVRPCNSCSDCRSTARGENLDLWTFSESDGSIKIEVIRSLLESALLGARVGRPLGVIIPKVERLTPQASNAILKILEEPPRRMTFLMGADSTKSVLPTILSRSFRLPLPSLNETDSHAVLKELGCESPNEAWRLSGDQWATAFAISDRARSWDELMSRYWNDPRRYENGIIDEMQKDEDFGPLFLKNSARMLLKKFSHDQETLSCLEFLSESLDLWSTPINKKLRFQTTLHKLTNVLKN